MNNIDQLFSQINYEQNNVRIVQCIAAHNEEDWITLTLSSIYNEVDKILVIQGATENRQNATQDGHSTDNTIKLIEGFDDPNDKIQLIQINRCFVNLEQQKNLFLQYVQQGDLILINDVDETYLPQDIRALRKIAADYPNASQFVPSFIHTWRDFYHCVKPGENHQCQHQRIVRYKPDMYYGAHPTLTDKERRDTYFDKFYADKRYTIPGMYIWHFGFSKSKEEQLEKTEFYKKQLKKFGHADSHNKKQHDLANGTQDLSSVYYVLEQDLPKVMNSHKLWGYRSQHLSNQSFQYWRDDNFYKLGMNTPMCWTQRHNKKASWLSAIRSIDIRNYYD